MADRYTSSAALLSKVLGLERRAQRPIDAWHASPYDFDKFSLDKIGTGQGAASYGHGFYAAESPAVSGPLGAYDMEFTSKRLRDAGYMGDMNDPIVRDMMAGLRKGMSDEELGRVYDPAYGRSEDDYALALMNARTLRENAAKLYELKLHAAPEDFLDYDASLLHQSPKVHDALERLGMRDIARAADREIDQDNALYRELVGDADPSEYVDLRGSTYSSKTGRDAYHTGLFSHSPTDGYENPARTSERMREAGIPGMRYLDGQSRRAGDGTRNYVIFDPEIIEIAKKYGLAPGAIGAGAMMGGDDE